MATSKKTKLQEFWSKEIHAALKREEKWRESSEKILKIYRGQLVNTEGGRQFNILWSNTEILKAATFSRVPEPNVARRYKDDGDVPREASEQLERVLEFYADEEEFTANIRKARDDMLLPGRGVVWLQYASEIERVELETVDITPLPSEDNPDPEVMISFMNDGVQIDPDEVIEKDGVQFGFADFIKDERVEVDYVFWKDFVQSNSRSWEDTWWCARAHSMSEDRIINELGQDAMAKVDAMATSDEDSQGNRHELMRVWEIWDKTKGRRYWYTEKGNDILLDEEVPLDLKGFFPCPKPIMPFETTDTVIPEPEYKIYQDQALDIDEIESRLNLLTRALRAVGIYNAQNGETLDLSNYEDGQLVPVDMAAFGSDGTLANQIMYLPLSEIAQVIIGLTERKAILKNEIYELTGISDIIRGATDPIETATSQRIKGSYGSLRLRPRREPIEELIRDIYRIMAEIVAEKFEPETIQEITGRPMTPDVFEFMRDDTLRTFRISVETDSTVQPNQELDKANAREFLVSMSGFMQQALPAAAETPELAPLLGEMIKFAAQQFKAGRTIEAEIDRTIDQLTEASKNQQPQGPTPEQMIEMQKLQMEQQKLQLEQMKLVQGDKDLMANLIVTRETNQSSLAEEQIKANTDITTEIIRQQTSKADNETQLASDMLDIAKSIAS